MDGDNFSIITFDKSQRVTVTLHHCKNPKFKDRLLRAVMLSMFWSAALFSRH